MITDGMINWEKLIKFNFADDQNFLFFVNYGKGIFEMLILMKQYSF